MLGPVIVTLSGLILLLATLGILGYYYFIRNISWRDLNIWLKWTLAVSGLVGTFFFVFGLTILSYMLIRRLTKKSFSISKPPNKNGEEMLDYFQFLGLDEKLPNILPFLTNKILNVNTDDVREENGEKRYGIPELDEKEVKMFEIKVKRFVKFYKKNKAKLDEIFDKNKEDFINKFLFYLAPSNRFIKYYFQTLVDYIKVENLNSTRMSQNPSVRKVTQYIYHKAIEKLERIGLDKIPSDSEIKQYIKIINLGATINKYRGEDIDKDIDALKILINLEVNILT